MPPDDDSEDFNLAYGRATQTPPLVNLGSIDLIEDGKARSYILEIGENRFHGFVVRKGESVFGYVDSCPHAGVTLARKLDDYLTPGGDLISCSWHGALFKIQTGECVGGPCSGQQLQTWPLSVKARFIFTA